MAWSFFFAIFADMHTVVNTSTYVDSCLYICSTLMSEKVRAFPFLTVTEESTQAPHARTLVLHVLLC